MLPADRVSLACRSGQASGFGDQHLGHRQRKHYYGTTAGAVIDSYRTTVRLGYRLNKSQSQPVTDGLIALDEAFEGVFTQRARKAWPIVLNPNHGVPIFRSQ